MKTLVLNPTAAADNNALSANNGSPKTISTLNTTKVSTMNTSMVRRWWSSFLLLGIVFSALAFSAEAKAASMTADFLIDGQIVHGTITAQRITMDRNNFALPSIPWYFTSGGVTYGPFWEGGLEYVPPRIGGGRKISLTLNENDYLDFTQTEGYTINCNGNYTLGIYEATSGKCVHNSNSSGTKSTKEIFDNIGTNLLDNKTYLFVYTDENGITIRRSFIYSNNQFFGN